MDAWQLSRVTPFKMVKSLTKVKIQPGSKASCE